MREVSTVDIPAVPDAEILDKAELQKRLGDHLGNRDAFIEEAMDRGHSEERAEEMWQVLNEAAELEGAGEPGKESAIERAGRAFIQALPGVGKEAGAESADTESEKDDVDEAAKEGRTLSQANRESAMAAVDANLDILHDAGVAEDVDRFTDRDDVDFDLSEHDARTAAGDHGGEEDEDEEEDDETTENAAGGDTPDSDDDTTMSDNDPEGEEKSLPEQNAEQIDDLADTVDEIHRAITGEEKTKEIEVGGETVEVSESELKSALGVEEEASEEDASMEERVKAIEARLDSLAEQGGTSNQIHAAAGGGDDEDDDALGQIGKALS